ncbi:MAG: helicase-related protein [Pseudomonadota bacterium]
MHRSSGVPLLRNNAQITVGHSALRRSKGGDESIIAVLGPTNTGKTYFAIERLLAHRSGMIGLPLRLLAREVYEKLVPRVGSPNVALVTGEEKIVPKNARYWVSTVEAMPLDKDVEFLAVDEIQLAADAERGRVFTSRLLHARGSVETVFIGSATIAPLLRRLFPDIDIVAKERFSTLSYSGPKKITRLPRRSALVAFSADTVYAIAELIKRQRGGAAVVLGALSPRTRNAQAELYQNGDVDYLVATDAIGMGLNMDIDHVAFAASRKFDGAHVRALSSAEFAQIAGRAGRHIRDGTFGVTAECHDLDDDIVEAIEEHHFPTIEALQWRSETLDFSSLSALKNALDRTPPEKYLRRARPGEDEMALARLATFIDVKERAKGGAALGLLWDVCQIPDFRKSAFDQHARLLAEIYEQIIDRGRVSEHWLEQKITPFDRTDGDIDAISARIAHVRTWTYFSNRSSWVENSSYWQGKTRSIEDALSDALHEKLTQRFVDRRTSVLARKLRDDEPLLAGVTDDGEVTVEGQFVGRLNGFQFILDPRAKGLEAKKARHAAERALGPILATRGAALANADAKDLRLHADGSIWWRSSQVALLEKGPAPLRPNLKMRGLDSVPPSLRGRVQDRLTDFLAARVESMLGDLLRLKQAVDAEGDTALSGLARGVAFRLVENFGAMSRATISQELKQIGQDERSKLRQTGVRFGEYTLHIPSLLKPAPAGLLTMLWALWVDKQPAAFEPPKAGLVSLPINRDLPHAYYYASGYRPSGERAVRIDMLERLAGLIRTARNDGSNKGGFETNQQMMSLVGCSGDDFESILRSLGYRKQTIKRAIDQAKPEGIPAEKSLSQAQKPDGTEKPLEKCVENIVDVDALNAAHASNQDAAGVTADNSEMKPQGAPDGESKTSVGGDPIHSASVPGSTESNDVKTIESVSGDHDTISDENETTNTNGEVEEIIIWRMAPKKPTRRYSKDKPPARPGETPEQKSTSRQFNDKDKRRNKGNGKKAGRKSYDNQRAPRRYSSEAPRAGKNKGPDPDSPFAVLAALKSTDNDKKENS